MRPKLTYANVTATLALIIAVGGASAFAAAQLAKNSVGAKQLKKNAVTTSKIKNGAVTGPKINLATLGTVPSATHATRATAADGAPPTGPAGGALKGSYPNPELVGPACPAGTLYIEGACLETATRTTAKLGGAIEACRDAGRRLPSVSELQAARDEPGIDLTSLGTWADGSYGGSGLAVNDVGNELGWGTATAVSFRCVTTPLR
jgi:hypothetical protein